jgi:DNA replication regulator DPB11
MTWFTWNEKLTVLAAQRQQIIEQVLDNGGEYHGDLTKNVTHLIVNKPEGAKYKHAKAWGLQLVSVEWLQDSLERRMILDERLFNPEWSVEERGKDAWNRKRTPLGKRPRDDNVALLDEGKRKLRRTASTKLSSQNEKIWGDIVGSNNDIQAANSREWGGATSTTTIQKAPQQQAKISAAQAGSSSESNSLSYRTAPSLSEGTFSGCHFYIHGFDRRKTQLLEGHLLSHEAEISTTLDNLIMRQSHKSYIVVSHLTSASELPEIPQSVMHIQTVTEWWVERCIGAKSLVDPAAYILGRPFPIFPLQRFGELTICSTGFEGLQLLHVSKAVVLMGAKYEEIFSKDVSVLICNSIQNIRREKLILAHEWKIPAISLDWLLESIQKGERQLFTPYIQRIKKIKEEYLSALATDEAASKKRHDGGGYKLDAQRRSEGEGARPAKASKIDPTAFQNDIPVKIKVEESVAPPASPTRIQPLAEISSNSPRKPQSPSKVVKQVERPVPPPAIPQHAISTAMTSLLAKSKTVVSHANEHEEQTEAQEGTRKKRAPSRILGRAASNASAASASSVDSTASTGQAVVWPSNKSRPGDRRSSSSLRANLQQDASLLALTKDLEAEGKDNKEDSQPPQTQMHYEDLESIEYQAKLLARINGEKVVRKEKERVATIASLDAGEAPRMRKGRALRERQGGGIR